MHHDHELYAEEQCKGHTDFLNQSGAQQKKNSEFEQDIKKDDDQLKAQPEAGDARL